MHGTTNIKLTNCLEVISGKYLIQTSQKKKNSFTESFTQNKEFATVWNLKTELWSAPVFREDSYKEKQPEMK